jgi:hypothetical protein
LHARIRFCLLFRLNVAEQQALSDVETIVELIANGTMHLECEPAVAADAELRGEHLSLQIVKALMPNLDSYDEVLPFHPAISASPGQSGLANESRRVQSAGSMDVPSSSSANSALPLASSSAEAELAAMRRELAESRAESARVAASQEAELQRLRKAQALHEKKLTKLEQDAGSSEHDAGEGLAYLSASASAKPARSAQQQREADEKQIGLLQRQLDDLTALVSQLHAHSAEQSGFRAASDVNAGSQQEAEARQQLAKVKAELTSRKSNQIQRQSHPTDGGLELSSDDRSDRVDC